MMLIAAEIREFISNYPTTVAEPVQYTFQRLKIVHAIRIREHPTIIDIDLEMRE